jgi:hypothetical protein
MRKAFKYVFDLQQIQNKKKCKNLSIIEIGKVQEKIQDKDKDKDKDKNRDKDRDRDRDRNDNNYM